MKSKKEEDKMDLTMFRDMLYNDNSISDELSSKKLQKQIAYGIKRRKKNRTFNPWAVCEEPAELIDLLIQPEIEKDHLIEECADVYLSIHYLAVFFNIKPKKTPVIGVGTPSDKNTLARKFSRQNLRTMKQVRAYIQGRKEKKKRIEATLQNICDILGETLATFSIPYPLFAKAVNVKMAREIRRVKNA